MWAAMRHINDFLKKIGVASILAFPVPAGWTLTIWEAEALVLNHETETTY